MQISKDLEVHRIIIKIIFLNRDLKEEISMDQLEDYVLKDEEYMVYKLCKTLYGFKQSLRA